MPTTVTWVEFNGSTAASSQGSGLATNLNFGNTDARNLNTALYPIAAGAHSYAKFFKVQFSGNFTQISNGKLWLSAGALLSGESLKFSGSYTKITPATTALPAVGSKVVPDIPTVQPATNNVCMPNTTVGVLPITGFSSPGYHSGSRTSMLAFQLQTTSGITAGPVNAKTISLTYDRQ